MANVYKGRRKEDIRVIARKVDKIITEKGDVDKALVHIVSNHSEFNELNIMVQYVLEKGADPLTACQSEDKTVIELAADEKKLEEVCCTLLAYSTNDEKNQSVAKTLLLQVLKRVKEYDKNGDLKEKKENDRIAAMLISSIDPNDVRKVFNSGETPCSFCRLVREDMQESALAVLDCCIESNESETYHYDVLKETDKTNLKTSLQLIAEKGNEDLLCHEVVKKYIKQKWKNGIQLKFGVRFALYLFSIVALTYSVAFAVATENPMKYNGAEHVFRAIAEVYTCLMAAFYLFAELFKFKRQKLEYLKDRFNLIDLLSTILLLAVIPLRLLQMNAQWKMLSVAHVCWTLRIFKFAVGNRKVWMYAQILWITLTTDVVPFMLFFLVILVAFSGAFSSMLRAEDSMYAQNETSSFRNIFVLGARILVEEDKIVEYADMRPLSCIILFLFLFTCWIFLLNILIAQLSNTYEKADMSVAYDASFAHLVARNERNSIIDILLGIIRKCKKSKENPTTNRKKAQVDHKKNKSDSETQDLVQRPDPESSSLQRHQNPTPKTTNNSANPESEKPHDIDDDCNNSSPRTRDTSC